MPATLKKPHGPPPTEFQLWAADAVGQLLSHTSEVQPETLRSRISIILAAYTQEFAEGSCATVAETASCPIGVLYSWLDGTTKPQIENLLRVWHQLRLPVSVMFTPDGIPLLLEEKSRAMIRIRRRREVTPRQSREQITRALERMLAEQPARSLNEVARSLGYATTAALRRANPEACDRIIVNYHRSGRSHWWSRRGARPICELSHVRKVLKDHLRAKGRIPPMNRIATSLGYASESSLHAKFPDLCRALAAKIARQRVARRAAIAPTLERALRENPPPTILDICRRIGLSAVYVRSLDDRALCDRLKARRREYAEACRVELLNKLKAVLNEAPPPAPKEVYKRLGITESIAYHNFPDLRRAIILRHRQYRHQQSCARQEAVRHEIRAAVSRLHKQGVCPSVSRVWRLVKSRSLLKWPVFTEAVRDARKALAID